MKLSVVEEDGGITRGVVFRGRNNTILKGIVIGFAVEEKERYQAAMIEWTQVLGAHGPKPAVMGLG
jgi:hypothetical protein